MLCLPTMERKARLQPVQPVHFTNRLELVRGAIRLVFGEVRSVRNNGPIDPITVRPAWFRYVNSRPNPLWKSVSPEERQRAAHAIKSYFASLPHSPTQDFNFLFFRGYEQQGSN